MTASAIFTYLLTFILYFSSSLFAYHTFSPSTHLLPNLLDNYPTDILFVNILRVLLVFSTILGCPLTLWASRAVLLNIMYKLVRRNNNNNYNNNYNNNSAHNVRSYAHKTIGLPTPNVLHTAKTTTTTTEMDSSGGVGGGDCSGGGGGCSGGGGGDCSGGGDCGSSSSATTTSSSSSPSSDIVLLFPYHRLLERLTSTVLVSICCLLAIAVPNIKEVCSWTGSTATLMVAYWLPCLFYLLVHEMPQTPKGERGGDEDGRRKKEEEKWSEWVEEEEEEEGGGEAVALLMNCGSNTAKNRRQQTTTTTTTTAAAAVGGGGGYRRRKVVLDVGEWWKYMLARVVLVLSSLLMVACVTNKIVQTMMPV
eukprot:GHVS01020670.1.p1 GENE.GHVS01020670.1~~GHVS01020670.1.p1  ORF type:complete len:402 (+),score=197.89 GHVS01020670.1:116-1207(+)